MVLGIAVGDADRLSLWLLGIISTVQMEAAAVQMHKPRVDAIDLLGMGGNIVENFADPGSIEILQTTSQGVTVEVIRSYVRIDQLVDWPVVQVVWHQI